MINPQIIVIDGPDGVGKTTQVQQLADFITSQGTNVHLTRASGGTPIGEELRKASLSPHKRLPQTDLHISLAMHTELGHDIQLKKQAGMVVIVDRSPLSLLAYNVYGSQLEPKAFGIKACQDMLLLWGIDHFMYLDAPQDVLDSRRTERGITDYFEAQSSDYHLRVRQGYAEGLSILESSSKYAQHLHKIDGRLSVEDIQQQVQQTVAR